MGPDPMPTGYEVVVPAWNAEEFLGATLDSLLAQEVPPGRITVVNDRSSDRTVDIARSRGVAVVDSPGSGVVAARNHGLSCVESEFVAFVDADDLWHPEFGRRVVDELTACGELSAVGTLVTPFGDADLRAWQGPEPWEGLREIGATEVWDHNPVTASAVMYRTAGLRRIGGWREGYTPTDDYDLVLRMVGSGQRIAVLGRRLAGYRVRSGSWSSRIEASLESETKALLDFAELRGGEVDENAVAQRLRALWWRSVARTAQYGQPMSPAPHFPGAVRPTVAMRAARLVLGTPRAGDACGHAWRLWRRRLTGARQW